MRVQKKKKKKGKRGEKTKRRVKKKKGGRFRLPRQASLNRNKEKRPLPFPVTGGDTKKNGHLPRARKCGEREKKKKEKSCSLKGRKGQHGEGGKSLPFPSYS